MKIRNLLILVTLLLFIPLTVTAFQCNEDCIAYNGANASTPGITVYHAADSDISYDWFTYVPKSINKNEKVYILVYSTGGLPDYEENTDAINSVVGALQGRAELHQFILLLPSIPNQHTGPNIYTIAMDERVFNDTTDEFRRRPDLKVNKMIDKFTIDLTNAGFNVHAKAMFEGFSAGGMFVQRYTLLHPDRVQSIGGGQCGGGLTLPASIYTESTSSWDGFTMDWAIGINNFTSLAGYEFDFDEYKKVPHLIYIGDQDTINSHLTVPSEGFWTQEQLDFVNEVFGDTDPVRLRKQCEYMEELGCDVTFILHIGYGHEITPWQTPEIYDQVFEFHESHKEAESNNGDGGGSGSGGGGGGCYIDTLAY